MVKKNNTIKNNTQNNDKQKGIIGKLFNNTNSTKSNSKIKPIEKIEVEENLKQLHSKIDLETIRQIDNKKDVTNKKKDKFVKKIYPYWVYIFKDGKKIKDFGVREEELNGIKLLIRTEKVNDELKVVFRELYPESKFDSNILDSNKKRLSQELNLLKQIEKELETELFDKGETNEYNYDLADVRIAILEKEVMLDSIKYGKSFRYFQDIRDDGIPCLFYEFENNGLRLKKEVKEKSLFTEASEVKQIESLETKRDIDEQLKKKDERDWKKIAYAFLWAIITIIYVYGAFQLLDYNHERAYGEIQNELEKTMITYNKGFQTITANCGIKSNDPIIQNMQKIIESNNEIIQSCMQSNLIDNAKPTITG